MGSGGRGPTLGGHGSSAHSTLYTTTRAASGIMALLRPANYSLYFILKFNMTPHISLNDIDYNWSLFLIPFIYQSGSLRDDKLQSVRVSLLSLSPPSGAWGGPALTHHPAHGICVAIPLPPVMTLLRAVPLSQRTEHFTH